MGLHYDPASGSYTATIPPGTKAFRDTVGSHYGFRTEVIRDEARCAHQPSEHCECRAIDFFVQAPNGRPLFDWAVTHADPLGIQSVIHDRRVWGFGDWTERPYTRPSPHTDHVHIGLTIAASHLLTEQMVRRELGAVQEEDMYLSLVPGQAGMLIVRGVQTKVTLAVDGESSIRLAMFKAGELVGFSPDVRVSRWSKILQSLPAGTTHVRVDCNSGGPVGAYLE